MRAIDTLFLPVSSNSFVTPPSVILVVPAQPIPPALVVTTEAFLRSLPSRSDVIILSDHVGLVPALYYQSDYKAHAGKPTEEASTSADATRSLLQPEDHTTLLARQMLLFAGALRMSPREVIPGLCQHQHVTMEALAEAAIKLVKMDEALLGSLEGIGNLICSILPHRLRQHPSYLDCISPSSDSGTDDRSTSSGTPAFLAHQCRQRPRP